MAFLVTEYHEDIEEMMNDINYQDDRDLTDLIGISIENTRNKNNAKED